MANSDQIKLNPVSPAILRRQLLNKAERIYVDHPIPVSDKMRQMLAGSLSRCFTILGQSSKDAKRSRYAVTEWITGYTSVYDVPEAVVRSMLDWLDMGPKPKHTPSEKAITEIDLVLNQAIRDQGQGELL